MKFSGKKLSKIREAKGLTQDKLADLIGVKRQQVSCWEGNVNKPSADYLAALSVVLVIKIDDLFEDGEAA
jgi:transcriptional regulator with XRE-family HTH domain